MPQMANYQEVGEPKPGATVLLESTPAGKPHFPLLVTENFGRGRTMLFATEGSWRWKMWLDHADKTHATFWQQIFRYLVTDTPGQVTSTTPRQVLSDDTRVPIRVQVRDKQFKPVTNAKVQARFLGPDGSTATMELAPVAARRRRLRRRMDRRKAGLLRSRNHRRPRAGRDRPRRAGLPPRRRCCREFPHVSEPRASGEAFAADGRPVLHPLLKRPNCRMRFPTPKPASPRAKPATCGICRSCSCWPCASAPPNGCSAGSGE